MTTYTLPVAIIIPGRLQSVRLPRKLLLNTTGQPLIAHTVRQALRAKEQAGGLIKHVIAAVDGEELAEAARAAGAEAVLTRSDHPSGTDRIAEVARDLDVDVVINVQADEPEVQPEDMLTLARALGGGIETQIATLASPMDADRMGDPNAVKVVLDIHGNALYFSRAPIPWERAPGGADRLPQRALLHIGMYAYRRGFLMGYSEMHPSPLEQCEQLEQLRILELGYRIKVCQVEPHHGGIDTQEDYDAFVARMHMESEDS